jgi:Asp-tRNA(Asn)/Glu-tRNA(Gln) amidotransferase A subunit family amidase
VQLVAPHGADLRLLEIALAFEELAFEELAFEGLE